MKRIILLFFIFCYSLGAYAQSVQNCPGGIQVCQPVYVQPVAYTGPGSITELYNTNDGCLSADPGEQNSVWYIVTVTAPGILVFTITPNQPITDYDWAMWDITNNGCSSIYNYTTNTANAYGPVRCNTSESTAGFNPSGITGLSTTACCPSQGAGATNAFSSALNVTAGQVFAICLDNWSASTAGYTLDFSASTASIFDTTHPRFDTIGTYCGPTDSISFGVSEAVKCTSLANNGSDFSLTPPVAVPIYATGLTCGGTTGTTTTFIGLKFSAILPSGNYVLHAQVGTDGNTLLDYCGNSMAVGDSIAFTILAPPPPKFDTVGTYCGPTDSIFFGMSQAVNCGSLAANGSDFSITPALATPVFATGLSCAGAGTNSIGLKLSAPLPPGNYVLHAKVGTDGNTLIDYCNGQQVVGDSIAFTILAPPILSLTPVDTICLTDPEQLNVTVTNPSPGITYTYQWTPNLYINSTNIASPIVSPPSNITYYVTVDQNTAISCSSTDSAKIVVLPNDFTLFNHDTAICIGASVQVNASGISLFSYTWTPVSGVSDPAIIDPLITPDTTNTYVVTANFPGCPPMVHSFNIEVIIPSPTIPISKTTCVGIPVQFDVTAPQNESFQYSWSPDTYLSNDSIPNPIANPTAPGDITYLVTVRPTLAGCFTYDSVKLHVWPLVKLVVDPLDTLIPYGSSAQLTAMPVNINADTLYYLWTPDNGTLNNTAISNPVATPLDSTTYTVLAIDPYGCMDSEKVKIAINFAMNQFVPTAFSPNNDGKNDVFRVLGVKYQKLIDFRIFNRWGQVIFQTTDPEKGWDGTFNGVPQEIGTYNYMFSVVLPDGTEKMYRGAVTLIR